jgi:parallel beta-helix repeat protein
VTIRNCNIGQSSTSDGIRIDGSTDALVFNNLIFQTDRGILITGAATGAQVINNTIVSTQRTGIALTVKSAAAPTGATLINNIIEGQGTHLAINVDQGPPSAQDGYTGNFNLVFEASQSDQTKDYSPVGINGANDLNVDALLINLDAGDVHLSHDSPAVDAGDDSIDASLVSALTQRSTQNDGSLDRTPLDMGYHYP